MPRYMAFLDEPVDPADFDIEFDPDASLAENTSKLADAVGINDGEVYYTMSKFYAVAIFEAEDNRAAEEIVRKVSQAADVQVEVVPAFTPSELGT